jgi:hypothetical protein
MTRKVALGAAIQGEGAIDCKRLLATSVKTTSEPISEIAYESRRMRLAPVNGLMSETPTCLMRVEPRSVASSCMGEAVFILKPMHDGAT